MLTELIQEELRDAEKNLELRRKVLALLTERIVLHCQTTGHTLEDVPAPEYIGLARIEWSCKTHEEVVRLMELIPGPWKKYIAVIAEDCVYTYYDNYLSELLPGVCGHFRISLSNLPPGCRLERVTENQPAQTVITFKSVCAGTAAEAIP